MTFNVLQTISRLCQQLGGAILFYTCLPLPSTWPLDWVRVARWAPGVGLLIGVILGGLDGLLAVLRMPILTRSVLVVVAWIAITGGLHLDGAIDTADGLAVPDPQRRLEVMADSRTGAFGVMAAIALLLLKISALREMTDPHPVGLMVATTWGRWAQVWAIARYPYLKPEGKGAFHRCHFQLPWDLLPGMVALASLGVLQYFWASWSGQRVLISLLIGMGLTWGISAWFGRQFQGMTGDIYGAIVEWIEALMLCCLTML